MPITEPTQASIFNANYASLGEYVSDDSRIPYFNPSDSGVMLQAGEPILVQWGASGEERVYLCNRPIRPGEWGELIRHFTADFPCDFSANVIAGQEVYWDEDNSVVSLVGDVTNGFVIGDLSWSIDPNIQNTAPSVDGDGRVIAGTTSTTRCRIVSRDAAATTKGTVTILALGNDAKGPVMATVSKKVDKDESPMVSVGGSLEVTKSVKDLEASKKKKSQDKV